MLIKIQSTQFPCLKKSLFLTSWINLNCDPFKRKFQCFRPWGRELNVIFINHSNSLLTAKQYQQQLARARELLIESAISAPCTALNFTYCSRSTIWLNFAPGTHRLLQLFARAHSWFMALQNTQISFWQWRAQNLICNIKFHMAKYLQSTLF